MRRKPLRCLRAVGLGLCAISLPLLAAFLISRPLGASAPGFAGIVTDMVSERPIAGARVVVGASEATTDRAGRYVLSLPPGAYDVRAEAPGYIGMTHTRQRVSGEGQTTLDFQMMPSDPTPEQAAIIRQKTMPEPQELPAGLWGADLSQGYALSAVTVVPRQVRVLMPDESVVVMDMDEYLKGVVPSEVPACWPAQALRAQAVAARSIAATSHRHADKGADVCTTVHCQVWRGTHYDTTDRAVDETHGVVGRYEGKIISAFFSAHCDGHTRNSEDVWGGYLPYCRSVVCPCGFTTRYGHGVGMCQEGSRVLAQGGADYVQILKHYYTGIDVPRPAPGQVTSVRVSPASGNQHTVFTYEATFTSELGDLPVVAHVIIDGRAHALERVTDRLGNTWQYRLATRLPVGAHDYRFYFEDGYGSVSAAPDVGAFSGPLVTEAGPSTPTPTPLPTVPPGTHSATIVHSTTADWADGSFYGVQVVALGDGALRLTEGSLEGTYTSAPILAPLSFVALGALWYADLPAASPGMCTPPAARLELAARTRLGTDEWGPWRSLRPSEVAPSPVGLRASDLLFGQGTAVQYRVQMVANGAGQTPVLRQIRLILIDSRTGPAAAPGQTALGQRPAIISRSEWGADERLMNWTPEYRPPRAVILHHTRTDSAGVAPAAAVRALYEYHARYLDRGDLAYNYLVDAEGCVYEGRAGGAGVVGAHAAQYDWGSIGVALLDDYDATDVPAAMLAGLTELLAWQCADHQIDPMGEELFIDTVLPSIMAHQDCRPTACPGRRLYALLPQIRSETLQKMAHVPPQIRLIAPTEGSLLRAVQPVSIEASAAITRVDIYVDGALRIRDRRDDAPDTSITSRWNTTLEADGPRRLRVVALNSAGQGEAEITVIVDNTPPGGSANVAAWSRTFDVPIALSAPDAVTMQISNGWWWEGEDLPRSVGMGGVISDATALSGLAWHGRAGSDPPGGVYGPYACNLAAGQSYTVCFRLRTPHYQRSEGLATLDVVDSGGERLFSRRALAGWDFAGEGYEEFCLDLAYPDRGATCRDPDVRDGLEFRTWFSGRGDLSLDRVTVYSAPRTHLESVVRWTVSPVQGAQDILLRFLDEAGNAFLYPLTVRVDTMPPVWFGYEPGAVQVQDEVSGLDPATAAWTVSHDGGDAWGAWQPLSVQASSGSVEPLRLQAPAAEGTHVRFRLSDVAGNASESAPVSLTQLPTPSPTASPSPTATATVTPEATLPPPSPTPDRAHRVTIPLLLK